MPDLRTPGDPTASPLREEAKDPSTTPERLRELINLPGNRGDIDSDSGWCREYVAQNPSASPDTLAELAADMDDFLSRLYVARNPATLESTVKDLAYDPNDQVANAALARLGLPERQRPTQFGKFMPPRFRNGSHENIQETP